MKLKYDFIVREVGERYVAVAVGEHADEFHGIIKMNKSGAIMLAMLKEEITKEELLKKLMDRFEGTEDFFSAEIDKFTDVLRKNDALLA